MGLGSCQFTSELINANALIQTRQWSSGLSLGLVQPYLSHTAVKITGAFIGSRSIVLAANAFDPAGRPSAAIRHAVELIGGINKSMAPGFHDLGLTWACSPNKEQALRGPHSLMTPDPFEVAQPLLLLLALKSLLEWRLCLLGRKRNLHLFPCLHQRTMILS